jgi:hypothetical protein
VYLALQIDHAGVKNDQEKKIACSPAVLSFPKNICVFSTKKKWKIVDFLF